MYESPYSYRRPYAGQTPFADRCPICGSLGDCPDTGDVAMTLPPFDVADTPTTGGGPLRTYVVTVDGFTTQMQLNPTDAARYGADAAQPLSEVPYVE